MDGKRFDRVTKSLASGASRRSVLKGLLGLGGAAVAGGTRLDDASARTVGSRPRIPPPPPPPPTTTTTPAPTTTTANPCLGFTCGLDCCATGVQCCDGECCPTGTSCLTQLFPEDPTVQEETCCRSDLACGADPGKCCADGQECCADEGCCDGRCYFDVNVEQELCCSNEAFCQVTEECCDAGQNCCADEGCCQGPCYVNPAGDELCCPAAFATVCGNECCANGTHECCPRDGVSTCIPIDGCCLPSECPVPENECRQATCPVGVFQCGSEPKPNTTTCNDGNACTRTDTCQSGSCIGSNPVVCQPLDRCQSAGACDPGTGVCGAGTPIVCPTTNECYTSPGCDPVTGCRPQVYNGDGSPCSAGVCSGGVCCTPRTACDPGVCAMQDDNCGSFIGCPACPAGYRCDDTNRICIDDPTTCRADEEFCPDRSSFGCGGALQCFCTQGIDGAKKCIVNWITGGQTFCGSCSSDQSCVDQFGAGYVCVVRDPGCNVCPAGTGACGVSCVAT